MSAPFPVLLFAISQSSAKECRDAEDCYSLRLRGLNTPLALINVSCCDTRLHQPLASPGCLRMDNHDGKSTDAPPEENMEEGIPLTAAVKARVDNLEQRRIELLQKVLKNHFVVWQ